jgi:hypothetical protein
VPGGVHTRREALKRGLALVGAAGTGALLFDAAPAAADGNDGPTTSTSSTTSTTLGPNDASGGDGGAPAPADDHGRAPLALTGTGFDVSAPDFAGGTLPAPGQRLLTSGVLLDASGAPAGQVVGAYVQLVPFGQAGPTDPVSLLDEVLVLADGTICGRGLATADLTAPVTFAVTGGTGRYAGMSGAWTGAQQFLSLGGDGSAQVTFTPKAEGSHGGS